MVGVVGKCDLGHGAVTEWSKSLGNTPSKKGDLVIIKKREAQMNMTEMKLLQDCPTRWNSTFYMLERLVQLRWPVIAVLSDDSVSKRSDRYYSSSS